MERRNVLVFPCGSEIGLEIHRSVRYSTHFRLFGASSVDDHGRFVYDRYIPDIPFVESSEFGEAINRTILENDIQLIMPAHDSVVVALALLAEKGQLACKLVTSPLATCELTRSKRATYAKFAGIIPTPEVYETPESARYPVFLKPDIGQGSKGAVRARNLAHAAVLLEHDPSLLALEYLPGSEFTVDCFSDRHRNLLYAEGRHRSRISNGISVRSQRINDIRFRGLAERINDTIKLRGAWFYQVKERANAELVLMEIAPRVAGTMSLSRAYGANLPLLSLFDALEMPVSVSCNAINLIVDRSLQSRYAHDLTYNRVYLDFDDTVIVDGQINTALMAFVYQCRNRSVPVSLITRHAGNLEATLRELRMERLFDEIIWLQEGEDKAAHISDPRSIFIDDSWTERTRVQDICRIPVFDPHMIEVLMEGS